MTFTAEQTIALEAIIEWACRPFMVSNGMILSGYAGTGKTTLLRHIVKSLKSQEISSVLCAPTNKAVKVLKNLGTNSDCCTIYSLLGLEMSEHEDTLKLVKKERDRASNYQLVVLDECSMISSELFEYILEAMKKYNVKFLFVGDPEQLNPIGEEISPVWQRYETQKLTEVVRHDNQILNLATNIRSATRANLTIQTDHDEAQGVWCMNKAQFVESIRQSAKEFESDTKAIAWRNVTVDHLNRIIRQEIHGEKIQKSRWLQRDKIVFTSPYNSFDDNLAPYFRNIITDEEATILSVEVKRHSFYPELWCYYLKLDFEDGLERNIMALHEDSEAELKKVLAMMANNAKSSRKWDDFWTLKKSIANIKYAYAITAHRAQGSTYTSAFVDVGDILLNRNLDEAKRCLYVALTRPTTRLVACLK